MPEPGQSPPKADPAGFALRAPPRPVTRLSRRMLVIATAMLTALLFAALWWALDLHPLKLAGGPELYNTDAKPDDALAALPGGYAELTKPRQPAPPPAVPRLGPPLPGDLAAPLLKQQAAFGSSMGSEPDAAAQQRERERQQAAESAVLFTISARQTAAAASGGPAVPGIDMAAAATGAGRRTIA